MTHESDNLTTYVGIDVSKSTLDIYHLHNGQIDQVKNNGNGYRALLRSLKGQTRPVVVFEATGGYEKKAACFLQKHGIDVAIVNPQRVRDYARCAGRLAKTDILDARMIAEFGYKIGVRVMPQWDENREKMRLLLHRKRELIEQKKREEIRLKQISDKWLQRSYKGMIDFLNLETSKVDRAILAQLKKMPVLKNNVDLLVSIPGVGSYLALTMLIELPELGQCNRKAIAMLAGLAPLNRDSGTMSGQRSIHGGRQVVRNALFMPILSAIRCNRVIRRMFQRLKGMNKPGKVCLVACMRKLLIIANAMIRDQTTWQGDEPIVDEASTTQVQQTAEHDQAGSLHHSDEKLALLQGTNPVQAGNGTCCLQEGSRPDQAKVAGGRRSNSNPFCRVKKVASRTVCHNEQPLLSCDGLCK